MTDRDNIFRRIAGAMLVDYVNIFYVDMTTNAYYWYYVDQIYHSLQVEQEGDDFFASTEKNVGKIIYEEDRVRVLESLRKERLLENIVKGKMEDIVYRLMLNGQPVYHKIRLIQDKKDGDNYLILGVKNVDAEVRGAQERNRLAYEKELYNQITNSLVARFDEIYYVHSETGRYRSLKQNEQFEAMQIAFEGENFFSSALQQVKHFIVQEDWDKVSQALSRNYLEEELEKSGRYLVDYRMTIGGKVQYTRLSVSWATDRLHMIFAVENIDEETRREKARVEAMQKANQLARKDALTGAKNKNAYIEAERALQEMVDAEGTQFGVVVCDLNNLKRINDLKGHNTGDEYIRQAYRMICAVFSHSPVFRTGGDEFAVFLTGSDFFEREYLMSELQLQVHANLLRKEGPVLAAGLAVFDKEKDRFVREVYERADKNMYDEKTRLKKEAGTAPTQADVRATEIPHERRRQLNAMFEAFEMISEGTHVYLCDMKYDYSRWSESAVEAYGLPGVFMFNAGVHWQNCIHPDDRERYRVSVEEIFAGKAADHDMQYRVRRVNGEYTVISCRGCVLFDADGKPEYFCGTIRDQSIRADIDVLTGLRNLYGFLENVQAKLRSHTRISLVMVGIRSFSEINEVYGYHFGNRVLQRFGRHLYEFVGDAGMVYRMDGTKFAVITEMRTPKEIRERYETLRNYFRHGVTVEDKNVLLDLNAGLLTVDHFEVDNQTVYSCLNFAYGESKVRRQGEMVEFYNNLSDENRNRIEKFHTIRASIMRGYSGFFLLYQPVVDAKEEKLVGAEALLRWKSDEYGVVPPNHFIPLLERDPLFPELGQWILRRSLIDAKRVMEKYPEFHISVNLSYTQLERPDFVDRVLQILEETAFPPEHLCLEITERCRLLDLDLLKNIIVNLRGKGIRIALDDFGTGFSSVGLVKNLPFDTIKIDRSFVLKIEEDEKERGLMENFTGVASTYGAKVCVEGVETAGMRNILLQYRVQSLQGYYYAKPLSIEDFLAWQPQTSN